MWGIIALCSIGGIYLIHRFGILSFILEVLGEIGESLSNNDFDIFD